MKDPRSANQKLISQGMKFAWKRKKAAGGWHAKPTKYGNVKCEWQGEKFDSKRELERHLVLLDMQKHGEIRDLKRQPKFVLIVNAVKVGEYWPDWRYYDLRKDVWVCEDAKGFQTPEFKLKFAIARAQYGDIDWRLS